MTYTSASPIMGTSRVVSGSQITSWFAKIGPDYARWLHTPYMPVAGNYGDLIVEYARKWQPLDSIVVAAQIAHESAGGQSQFFRERNNPSGLGAINSAPGQAIWFDTAEDGVQATVAHLLTYTSAAGPWTAFDPRAAATPAKWQGTVTLLRDLEQKWAFTPAEDYQATSIEQRYGGRIAALMNDLVDWIGSGTNDRPRIAAPEWQQCIIPTSHQGRAGLPIDVQSITIHDTDNRSAGADEAAHCTYLLNGAEGRTVSWHGTVGDSGFWQHLPWDEVAWHAGDGYYGAGNRTSLAVEMTVDSGEDFEAALQNLVDATAWLLDEHSLTTSMIFQHNHWHSEQYPTGKNCPRWMRETGNWERFLSMVQERLDSLNRHGDVAVVKDPNARFFDETEFWIINQREVRMLDLWNDLGGLGEPDPVGYPLGGMRLDEDGVYRQLCENRLLEYNPATGGRSGGLGQRFVELRDECRAA